MFKLTIPPSSNWNYSRSIDCNDYGMLTYASRNDLIIIKPNVTGNTSRFDFQSIYSLYKEKIVSVILSPVTSSRSNCVVTCSEDGFVSVWDLLTLSPKQNHTGHEEGKRVVGLDWSHADPNLIVSVDENANVICWNVENNTIRRLPTLTKISPVCLACSPHNKNVIAVGGKLGYLQVLDIRGQGRILLHARGQANDLTSVSWCPVLHSVFDSSGAKVATNQLLATGASGRTICVWEIGGSRKSERILSLPNSPMGRHIHRKKLIPVWICVKWIDANRLLCSSQFGELICWKLNLQSTSNTKFSAEPELLHDCHSKQLFAIGCPTFSRAIDLEVDKVGIWTMSADKQLVYYSLSSREASCIIPTIGGVVHCLALSVCDSNRLAIGTGDNKVLVWNMFDTSKLDITVHWNKILGKVLSLAWHPTEEHLLACGTSFGRVILIDIRPGKESVEFQLSHQEMVHELHWAPPLKHTDTGSMSMEGSTFALFVVADGKIFQYDAHSAKKDSVQLVEVLKNADFSAGYSSSLLRCNFAIKPDKTVFAVGNVDGSVHIIDCRELLYKYTIYAHRKNLNSLIWHPETVASCNEISPYRKWLAAAADGIKVYDIQDNNAHLVAELATHAAKVTCVSWSHHFNGRLVSASYDTSVQVWDVLEKTLLGTYVMHKNHVMACVFSPFDPDLIISGSSDYTLKVWSMTEEHLSQPLPKGANAGTKRTVRAIKNRGIGVQAEEEHVKSLPVSAPNSENTVTKHPYRDANRIGSITQAGESVESLPLTTLNSKDTATEEIPSAGKKFVFPVIGKRVRGANSIDKFYNRLFENQSAVNDNNDLSTVKLKSSSNEELTSENVSYLDFFGNRESMRNILKIEEEKLADLGRTVHSQYTALWRGDVTEMIQDAVKKKTLNDWVVSIAASASHKVWRDTCEAYASQLAEEGQYHKATTYLLAVNKIEEAINLLVEQNLFIEAMAIAKCRLPENNPIVESLLMQWGDFSYKKGMIQLATHCYAAAGNFLHASDVLARCKDLKSLLMSAVFASQAGAHYVANSRAKDCLNISILTNNWHIGEIVLTKYADLKYYKPWLETTKIISSIKKKRKLEVEVFQWLRGDSDGQMLLETLKASFSVSENMYTKLNEEVVNMKLPIYEKELWHYVSGRLATAAVAFSEFGRLNADVIRHIIKALEAASDFLLTLHESAPAIQLCFWLSPRGPLSEESIFVSSCKTEGNEELSKSLLAYLGFTVSQWLDMTDKKMFLEDNSDITVVKSNTVHSISEDNDDDTVKDSDAVANKKIRDIEWLIKLIETCFPYILDKESNEYFKMKSRKQFLLEQKSKLMPKRPSLVRKQGNKAKQKFTTKDKECRVLEETVKNIGSQEKDAKFLDQGDCMPLASCLLDALLRDTKTGVHIGNSDVEHTIMQDTDFGVHEKENAYDNYDKNRVFEGDLLNDPSKSIDITFSYNSVSDNEAIQRYDILIQEFETKRVSAPNPTIAYSQVKNVITSYIEPYDSNMAKRLSEKYILELIDGGKDNPN